MARRHEQLYALNAGGVDPEAVARIDLEKLRLAGEHPVANWLPRVLGPATLRPGTESLTEIAGNAQCRQIRFVRAVGTSYVLLMTPGEMRISLDGVVQQVPVVSAVIDQTAWTDVSTTGASVVVPTGITDAATLSASTTATARMRQTVSVPSSEIDDTHILRIVVDRGPILIRVGTTLGGDDVLADVSLDTGTHKIAFVPGALTVYIDVSSTDAVERLIGSVQFESTVLGGGGDLVLPTPWTTFAQVSALRTWQSIDVLFCGDGTVQQQRIEHRGPLSWGLATYRTDDGPFVSGSQRISLTPSALTGNLTMTASESVFRSGHVGALLELTQTNKIVQSTLSTLDQVTDYVTIIGVDAGRYFYRTGVGTSFIGTIVLERSFDSDLPTSWTTFASYVDGAATFTRTQVDDTLDNLTVHYRFRVTSYTSGSAVMTLEYESGIQIGRGRITAVTSETTASVETIRAFGNTSATRAWRIGDWSELRGWPRTPVIHDGRLHWFRADQDYGSDATDYYVHDDDKEGDSASFVRSVGSSGEEGVVWATSLDRLICGTPAFEAVVAASELDEPLTRTAYTVRKPSRRGCADIEPAEHSDGLFFVQRSGAKLYELAIEGGSSRYRSQDISRLNPAAYRPGIVRLAVQQQPDTRNYAVLSDGIVVILTYERDDKVVAITTASLGGSNVTIEDVVVIPEVDQDDVYLIVNRDGTRYHERFAKEAAQTSVATCALLDAHKVLTGSVSQISGGTHLAGETVQVWADGARHPDVTLDGAGAAALNGTYARVVYGLGYQAVFRSVKLGFAAQLGTAIGQTKIVHGVGIILANSCMDGIMVGRDADHMTPLPDIIDGAARTPSQIFTHYDGDIMPIDSDWNPDARLYLTVDSADGPCTVQSVVLDVETRDGAADGNG